MCEGQDEMRKLLIDMINAAEGAEFQFQPNGDVIVTKGSASYRITPLTIESGLKPVVPEPQTMSPGKIVSRNRVVVPPSEGGTGNE